MEHPDHSSCFAFSIIFRSLVLGCSNVPGFRASLLVISAAVIVLYLLTVRYLFIRVLNFIYHNYTVLGNSRTIKSLYLAFWMHLLAPVWYSAFWNILSTIFHTSESTMGLVDHLLTFSTSQLHAQQTGLRPAYFPAVQTTFGWPVLPSPHHPLRPSLH